MLFVCLAAANSDPSVFKNPERLDIDRQANRYLAFTRRQLDTIRKACVPGPGDATSMTPGETCPRP